ncbi:MAG: hybrid sensor histidine kinase/response regulator [Oligoflexia bacterium]|nr:hybrid sensor histidine kinase/response regulator [Oligoflexia bacterium]
MEQALRVLLVEDSEDDALLVARQIRKGGYELITWRVDSASGVRAAIGDQEWDVVVADYSMPGFNGLEALEILKESGLDVPFILISGTIGEETAVQAMKAGASDYLMKDNLMRLVPAIERELREAFMRRSKRRAEAERITLIERLQQALEARDEFLLIASHELRTPLTSLKLHIQLMKRVESQALPPEAKVNRREELLANLERQLERLTLLVEKLLDVSRITAGQLSLEISECDLSDLARKAIAALREDLTKANCRVRLRADSPVVGHWDSLRLEQILVNLLENAVKYAENSAITVTVESRGPNARLIVQDRGPGIAKADQERLFRRFERASSANHVGGLGLGLFIIKKIVDAHGGTIGLESARGQGAKFTIEIPKREALRAAS